MDPLQSYTVGLNYGLMNERDLADKSSTMSDASSSVNVIWQRTVDPVASCKSPFPSGRYQPERSVGDNVREQMDEFLKFAKRRSNGIMNPDARTISSRPTSIMAPYQESDGLSARNDDDHLITIERTDCRCFPFLEQRNSKSLKSSTETGDFVKFNRDSNDHLSASNASGSDDSKQRMTYLSTSSHSKSSVISVDVLEKDNVGCSNRNQSPLKPPSFVDLSAITDVEYNRWHNDADDFSRNRDRVVRQYVECGDQEKGKADLIGMYLGRWREEEEEGIPKTRCCFVGIQGDSKPSHVKMRREPLQIIRNSKRKSRVQIYDELHQRKSRRSKRKRKKCSMTTKTATTRYKAMRSSTSSSKRAVNVGCKHRKSRRHKTKHSCNGLEAALLCDHTADEVGSALSVIQRAQRGKVLKNGVSIPPIITCDEGSTQQRVLKHSQDRRVERCRESGYGGIGTKEVFEWTKSTRFNRVRDEGLDPQSAEHLVYSLGSSPRPRHREMPSLNAEASKRPLDDGKHRIPRPRASIVEKTFLWRNDGDRPIPRPHIVGSDKVHERDSYHSPFGDKKWNEWGHHFVLARSP